MDPASPRLDGWKAIATYLGRDERTAQRWRLRGLPVHQVPGGKRGTVFAFTHEIDEWLTQQQEAHHLEEPAPSADPQLPPDKPSLALDQQPTSQSAARLGTKGHSTAGISVVGLVAILLVTAIAGTKRWTQASPSPVVRAEISASGLTARTADGEIAFSIPARDLQPHVPSATVPTLVAERGREPIVRDFNGDGSPDVVAILAFREDRLVASHAVVSYSSSGALQWRYQVQRRLRFGDRDFEGPWRVSDRLVTREADGRLRLFLAFVDDVWWPSFIVSLDADGSEQLHFVNAGHLSKLQHLRVSDRDDVLLAVGVNNEYGSSVLTAIDPDAPSATSPQGRFHYTCRECPGADPARYILFPPAELVPLQSRPYNLGDTVNVTASEVLVSMQELADSSARSHYRLSRTLEVQSFGMSDVYWEVHKQFERRGEIDHTTANCPERSGRRLQVWTEEGWQPTWVRSESGQ